MSKRPSQTDWLKAASTALVFLAAATAAGYGGHATSATTVNPAQCVESSS